MSGMKQAWERGLSWEAWLDAVEENGTLWHALYERARVNGVEIPGGGPYRLLVLSEDWCGDAVNSLPWLARLAETSDDLELRVLRRDENPELMDTHLTGATRSIPVVMILDGDHKELGWWGPRPAELQAWVLAEGKHLPKDERYKHVRRWYVLDRGRTTLAEVLGLLEEVAGARV